MTQLEQLARTYVSEISNKSSQQIVSLTKKEANQQEIKRSYRVFFIGVSNEDKARFSNSRCMFLVSVGQQYHEGAKLEAALKCMNKNFKEVVVIVGDTIQRYTHAVHQRSSAEQLYSFALDEGSKWLERNSDIIAQTLTKPHKVFRWDDFRKSAQFDSYYARIDGAVKSDDAEYHAAFEKCSQEFLNRANRGNMDLAPNSAELCTEYLKEECTCICVWAKEENCEFLTYPYGLNDVWRITCSRYIDQHLLGTMREVAFDIKRNK